MHADAFRRHFAQRVVQRLDLQVRIAQEFGVVHIAELDVPAHGQIGCVDLQVKTGRHDGFVLGRHGIGERLQIQLGAGVVRVGLEHRDHPG